MGVDLFFVISGFVIGLSAFSEIERSGESGFRYPFFKRRLVRIVPLHYLTMLIFVVFISPELLFNDFFINLISHVFFVHNLSFNLHGAINGSNWSLGTEMQFYVLMLLIGPWIRISRWWAIASCFVCITWAWRYGATYMVAWSAEHGPFSLFVAATQLPGMLDEFGAGLLLARFVRSDRGSSFLNTQGLVKLGALFSLAVTLTSVSMMIYWRCPDFWRHSLMVIMFRTLLAISFSVILLFAMSFKVTGILRKLLSPLFYLGTISYGIYLWHLPVLLSLKKLTWMEPSLALPLVLLFTVIFSSVSWHFFEAPIMNRLRYKKAE
jgi:peptidoglycan/LPS O-acetylase OafA/YrhL